MIVESQILSTSACCIGTPESYAVFALACLSASRKAASIVGGTFSKASPAMAWNWSSISFVDCVLKSAL